MTDPKRARDQVVLTGSTRDELRTGRNRDHTATHRCYLCKRPDGAQSLALRIPGGGGARVEEVDGNLVRISAEWARPDFVEAKIRVNLVPIQQTEGAELVVPLCQECVMLLYRWARRIS